MRTYSILGLGLIGGSVGLGLAAARPDARVVGYDIDPAAMQGALRRGAITEASGSAEAAVAEADLVVLAMPVDVVPGVCSRLAGAVAPGAVVTDVGSAKVAVVADGERAFGDRFVGGHPMAGSERHGIEAADVKLFEGAWWILTPTEGTRSPAYSAVAELASDLGATPVAVAPDVHDSLVARLSHVPQLAASALVEATSGSGDGQDLLGLAGGGFRDVTRIAASDPDLWIGILRSNHEAVLEALGTYSRRLGNVAEMIRTGDWDELRGLLARAREARLGLFAKAVYTGDPVSLSLLIPDRPGVLAEVTTAAGLLGANIEDLRSLHSTEGGRGRHVLVIAGEDAAAALASRLESLGYHVEVGDIE